MPRLCELYPGVCLTTEEKAQKNLGHGSWRMPVGKECAEQNIHVGPCSYAFLLRVGEYRRDAP